MGGFGFETFLVAASFNADCEGVDDMGEGDNKTLIFRTSSAFLQRFRELDGLIDAADARQDAFKRQRDADASAEAAIEHSRLCQEMQDVILDELERHWGPMVIDDDPTRPELPDNWRLQFFGRILRLEYRERAAYKNE